MGNCRKFYSCGLNRTETVNKYYTAAPVMWAVLITSRIFLHRTMWADCSITVSFKTLFLERWRSRAWKYCITIMVKYSVAQHTLLCSLTLRRVLFYELLVWHYGSFKIGSLHALFRPHSLHDNAKPLHLLCLRWFTINSISFRFSL